MLFSYVLLCDFYPLYDFQLNTCPPAISPSAESDSRGENGSHNEMTISPEFHTRPQPAIKEFILAIWIFSLACEEVRQVHSIVLIIHLSFQLYRSSFQRKHILYERKPWHISEYFGTY